MHKSHEPRFLEDVEKDKKGDYSLSNVKKAFETDKIVCYIYDCNGDGLFYQGKGSFTPLFLEINYLDKSPLLTEKLNKFGQVVSSRVHIAAHLKRMFPNDYKEKVAAIRYTR